MANGEERPMKRIEVTITEIGEPESREFKFQGQAVTKYLRRIRYEPVAEGGPPYLSYWTKYATSFTPSKESDPLRVGGKYILKVEVQPGDKGEFWNVKSATAIGDLPAAPPETEKPAPEPAAPARTRPSPAVGAAPTGAEKDAIFRRQEAAGVVAVMIGNGLGSPTQKLKALAEMVGMPERHYSDDDAPTELGLKPVEMYEYTLNALADYFATGKLNRE